MSDGNEPQADFKMSSKNITMDYSKLMQLSVEELLYEAIERAKIIFIVKNEHQKINLARLLSLKYLHGSFEIKDAVLDDCIFDVMWGESPAPEADFQQQISILHKKSDLNKLYNLAHLNREREHQEINEGEFYSPKQLEMTEAVVSMSLGDLVYYHNLAFRNPYMSDWLDSASLLLKSAHSSFSMEEKISYKRLTDPRNEVLASIDLSRPDSEILSSLKSLLPSWREALEIEPLEGVARERNSPGKSILKKIITNKLIEFMDQMIFDITDERKRTKKEIAHAIYDNPSDDFINKTIMNSIRQLSCADYIEKVFSYIKSEGVGNKTVAEFMSD